MGAISERELSQARADAEGFLPATGHVLTRTEEAVRGGGRKETYAQGPEVDCRIAPMGGRQGGSAGDRIDDRTTHVVTLPAGTAITAKDRVEVDGAVYEVTAVRSRSLEVTRRVEVTEVFT